MPTYFIHPETEKPTPVPYVDHPTNENSDDNTFRLRSLQVSLRNLFLKTTRICDKISESANIVVCCSFLDQ